MALIHFKIGLARKIDPGLALTFFLQEQLLLFLRLFLLILIFAVCLFFLDKCFCFKVVFYFRQWKFCFNKTLIQ